MVEIFRQASTFRGERVRPVRIALAYATVAPMDVKFSALILRNLPSFSNGLALSVKNTGSAFRTCLSYRPLIISGNDVLSFGCHNNLICAI